MAQDKTKAQKGLAQKHLHSRISYLYQAATYLATVADQPRARTPCADHEFQKSESGGNSQCAVATPEAVSDKSLPISLMERDNRIHEINVNGKRVLEDFALCRELVAPLRAVSLKSQIRLSPAMKHTMCKHCDVLLVPSSTSTIHIENNSRGGAKPWADVLVTTCITCGTAKRSPVGAERQLRRESRISKVKDVGK